MDIKELNEFMRDHGFCNTNNEEDLPKKYVCDLVESALEEGGNKAIDEFVERLMNEQIIGCMLPDGFRADVVTSHTVDTIAKQMKKEGAE